MNANLDVPAVGGVTNADQTGSGSTQLITNSSQTLSASPTAAAHMSTGRLARTDALVNDDDRSESVPEVTVLMPCLNEAETLATCVRKALASLESLGIAGEVLIADNGSTDGTAGAAREQGAALVCGGRVHALVRLRSLGFRDWVAARLGSRMALWPRVLYRRRAGNLKPTLFFILSVPPPRACFHPDP